MDIVYKMLISEALKEPYSPLLINKAIIFFRRSISKYRPSYNILLSMSQFLKEASKIIGTKFRSKNELLLSIYFLSKIIDLTLQQESTVTLDHQSSIESKTNLYILIFILNFK